MYSEWQHKVTRSQGYNRQNYGIAVASTVVKAMVAESESPPLTSVESICTCIIVNSNPLSFARADKDVSGDKDLSSFVDLSTKSQKPGNTNTSPGSTSFSQEGVGRDWTLPKSVVF